MMMRYGPNMADSMIRDHLKHMMYVDCFAMRKIGTNHNAMDRSCVLECWLEDVASSNFVERFDLSNKRYVELRQQFKEQNFQCENPGEDEIEAYADDIASKWKQYIAAAANKDST